MTPSPDRQATRPETGPVEQRLTGLLTQLGQRIDDYLDYLQQLHGAIRDNDAARLEQLLPHDQALQQAVDERLAERARLLEQQGVENLEQLLEQLGRPAPLIALREDLETRLERLRRQLMSNDLLLRKSQQRLRQSIGILAGHLERPAVSAYSRNGDLTTDSPRRSLARA
jgi:hypothetical protein